MTPVWVSLSPPLLRNYAVVKVGGKLFDIILLGSRMAIRYLTLCCWDRGIGMVIGDLTSSCCDQGLVVTLW